MTSKKTNGILLSTKEDQSDAGMTGGTEEQRIPVFAGMTSNSQLLLDCPAKCES